ncbi:MAG: hypothetical protein RUMPE_00616 [Eubacteriales bacterium SKADARSKE-1]|nr:hypothetical protein [Eubacteriales bacterium SKADARSKE-1]
MIKVNFFITAQGTILGFHIKGHAKTEESGKDIICAAVSSAAYMTANTMSEIIKADADVSVFDSGEMYLKINTKDINFCRDILLGFKLHMIALEEQYPENIIVNYTEVQDNA